MTASAPTVREVITGDSKPAIPPEQSELAEAITLHLPLIRDRL